jgi:recombination protein RecA
MYTYNDLGFRGKEAFKLYLNENESVAKALEMTLRQLMEQEAPKEEAEGDSPNDLPEEIVSPGTSSEEELASVIEA